MQGQASPFTPLQRLTALRYLAAGCSPQTLTPILNMGQSTIYKKIALDDELQHLLQTKDQYPELLNAAVKVALDGDVNMLKHLTKHLITKPLIDTAPTPSSVSFSIHFDEEGTARGISTDS